MRIAIIGTRGIPPRYGGFETLASELGRELAMRGHTVMVYGRTGTDQPRHIEVEPRLFAHRVPVIPIEAFESITAGISGSLHSLRRFKPDVALVCNPANIWISKILEANGIPVILHMAGLEFMREKWKGLGSTVLKRAIKVAVNSKVTLLTDSYAIANWYQKSFNRNIQVIAYGAKPHTPNPNVLEIFGLVPYSYDIVVARFEPDTQISKIIENHGRVSDTKLVLVGEPRQTKSLKPYNVEISDAILHHPHLQVLGPIWDENVLDSLWSYSRTYIHGHRTGGTNPALLRAAVSETEILAFDNPFNREVLESHGWYWSSGEDLMKLLQDKPWESEPQRQWVKESTLRRYRWPEIASQYEELMQKLTVEGNNDALL